MFGSSRDKHTYKHIASFGKLSWVLFVFNSFDKCLTIMRGHTLNRVDLEEQETVDCESHCTNDFFCTWSDWSGNSSQCSATCGAVTESRNRRLIKVPVEFDGGEEFAKPSYDYTKHYLIKEDERSLCAWPRTRVLSRCLLFCFVLRWKCRRLPPFCDFKICTNAFIQNRVKNSATHPSTRMQCSDTPSSLTSKPPDEHVASPIFLHVDLIAHFQDGCSRQCIFETTSHRIADIQTLLASRHYRSFSVGW